VRKIKGDRDANTYSTLSVFLPRYREAHKLSLVLIGAPHKDVLARAKLLIG
jgi:hypothetical protein